MTLLLERKGQVKNFIHLAERESLEKLWPYKMFKDFKFLKNDNEELPFNKPLILLHLYDTQYISFYSFMNP